MLFVQEKDALLIIAPHWDGAGAYFPNLGLLLGVNLSLIQTLAIIPFEFIIFHWLYYAPHNIDARQG